MQSSKSKTILVVDGCENYKKRENKLTTAWNFPQNFIRKIGELGLKKLYHSNPELSLALNLIPSLAFEKLENVKSSFKLIVEDIQEVCEQLSLDSSEVEKIDELCSYFQNTYIEKNLREPLFPRSIWNKREAASEGVASTTEWKAFLRAMASLSMSN